MPLADYLTDPHIHHIGTETQTAYFIPNVKAYEDRESSERFFSLNGDWFFRYEKNSAGIDLEELPLTQDFEAWARIPVPSNWQMHSYDQAQYLCSPYPFLYDPPHVPRHNPIGIYARRFDYHKPAGTERYTLTFEGADSCLYCWLNGDFLGYAEGPHNQAAFDISSTLHEGQNTIFVAVYKWCSGSYLDDQDKIRMSGLFRDVYILARPGTYLKDFFATTDSSSIRLKLDIVRPQGEVQVQVLSPDKKVTAGQSHPARQQMELTLPVEEPLLWSAETPFLYTLRIILGKEWVEWNIGFRKVEIRDGQILLNGSAIKLLGVNRHESDPDFGFVLPYARMKQDLLLMKQHNINCVRTSHYPDHPVFYQLCDEYGLYVIDEADMETHGCQYVHVANRLMDDERYRDAILDRENRLVERDKNCTSVIIWSMGNESTWGSTLAEGAAWIKKRDPSRILNMEAAFSPQREMSFAECLRDRTTDILDITASMYPSYQEVDDHLAIPGESRPHLLIEYCHAMGNTCGGLKEYTEKFFSTPRLCGGCIWEWADQAVRSPEGQFLYGGDFGEKKHSGNLCADGLVSPDREPHSSLKEVKAAYSPIAFDYRDGALVIENRYAFLTLGHITLQIAWKHNGRSVSQLEQACPPVEPGCQALLPLQVPDCPQPGDTVLQIRAMLNREMGVLGKGHEITHCYYRTECGRRPFGRPSSALTVKSCDGFPSVLCAFEKRMTEELEPCIWRAPLDNDRGIKRIWMQPEGENINVAASSVIENNCADGKHHVIYRHGGMSYKGAIQGSLDWTDQGFLRLDARYSVREDYPSWLPRCGLMWKLSGSLRHVTYYGLGPEENYEDKRLSAMPDLYRFDAFNRTSSYVKPQESGGMSDVFFVTVTDDSGQGLLFTAKKPFFFNIQPWTPEEISEAAHPEELPDSRALYLHIDARMSGIGSCAVGPALPQEYRILPGTHLEQSIAVTAFDAQRDDPFALAGMI